VEYHTFLSTNFRAIISQQIVFVPLLLINIVVNKDHCSNCG